MDKIVIGGWDVTIETTHRMTRTDSDGFTFGKRFCIGSANWNKEPVYFALSGSVGGHVSDRFDSIEAMRGAYSDHLRKGWIPA